MKWEGNKGKDYNITKMVKEKIMKYDIQILMVIKLHIERKWKINMEIELTEIIPIQHINKYTIQHKGLKGKQTR